MEMGNENMYEVVRQSNFKFCANEIENIKEMRFSNKKIQKLAQKNENFDYYDLTTQINSLLKEHLNLFSNLEQISQGEHKKEITTLINNIVNGGKLEEIGRNFLIQKKIQRPLGQTQFTYSISPLYFKKLQKSLFSTDAFTTIKRNLKTHYSKIMDERIEKEISTISSQIEGISESMIQNYREFYYKTQKSFEEYLDLDKNNKTGEINENGAEQKKVSTSNAEERPALKDKLKKKELEQKKFKQQQSFSDYNDYFNMNDRKLRQAKRKGLRDDAPIRRTQNRPSRVASTEPKKTPTGNRSRRKTRKE